VHISFTEKEGTIRGIDDLFYKLNVDYAGFYRTNYPPSRLAKLGNQLDRLSIADKIGLIGDAAALAFSGEGTTAALLAFVQGFQSESNKLVWQQIVVCLNLVTAVFSEDKALAAGLSAFVLKLVSPAAEKIGWEPSEGEDYLTSQLRSVLLSTAGLYGHKGVIAEAQSRFELFTSGKDQSAAEPSVRGSIFEICVQYGGSSEYAAVKNEWQTTKSPNNKEVALRALGRFKDPALLDDYLKLLIEEVPNQDVHVAALALARNQYQKHGFWRYFQANFDTFKAKLSKSMIVFDRFMNWGLTKFNDVETEKEIANFFADKDNRGYDRTLAIISDGILGRAAYKERDAKKTLEWLKANGYA